MINETAFDNWWRPNVGPMPHGDESTARPAFEAGSESALTCIGCSSHDSECASCRRNGYHPDNHSERTAQ